MSKTAFYYLTGQIEGIEKAKDCLTGYFTKNGVPDKLAGDLSGLLDSLRRRLREEREDMMEDEYYDDDDEDDDDEDDDDEDSTPLTPDQALKFYDLYKQMGELQAKLEALSEEIEDGDVSETVSDAASGVEDAKFCLEDVIEDGMKINVEVDGEMSDEAITKMSALLKQMVDDDEEEEK